MSENIKTKETSERDERRERLAEIVSAARLRAEGISEVPRLYSGISIENVRPQAKWQERAIKILKAFVKGEREKGVLLCGKAGVGKTFLATAALNSCIYREADAAVEAEEEEVFRPSAIRLNVLELMLRLRAAMERDAREREESILLCLKKTKILMLDDLGAQQKTEYSKSVLFDVVNYRRERILPMLITTNATRAVLEAEAKGEGSDIMSQRIAWRLLDACVVVEAT